LLEKVIGIHASAPVPPYQGRPLRKRLKNDVRRSPIDAEILSAEEKEASINNSSETSRGIMGRVLLFTTCYANYNEPQFGEDLVAVFKHNGILLHLPKHEVCCGMPKLEIGDLDTVEKLKNQNVPELVAWIREGWDIITPVPSCTLMFKQELPLLFQGDWEVETLARHTFDPFEYLALWHRKGHLNTEFKQSLGKISYHVPCHLRVQNMGLKTKEILSLVPDTQVHAIERCSGHNGTYAIKKETHDLSVKIGTPAAKLIQTAEPDHYGSDCPMAGRQLQHILDAEKPAEHPMSLLRLAYGI
jgi:glycerol-3-phosphate dehydrogenase subunit C